MSTVSGKLHVRVDDYPGTKPEEFYRHNLENFVSFHNVLSGHGLEYVLGVIPGHTTDNEIGLLSRMSGLDIALHGVNHDERFLNEFNPYVSVHDVQERLRVAKSRLEMFGCVVDTYIPPHNVIDARTVNALQNIGFTRILGGPGTDDHVVEYASTRVPIVCSWPPFDYGRSDELLNQRSVEHVVEDLASGKDVWLSLHWTWEWNIGLGNLETYLTKLVSVARERGIMVGHGQV